MKPDLGKTRYDETLQPVSGKAVPVRKGEILRISQVGEGGQAVSFNCFNLDDYKEYMSVGHMRREGFHAKAGNFVWSNPPRYRPMMKILSMSPTCGSDVQDARCCGALFETQFGIDDQPNCQDTLGEAAGEFGLSVDDIHDVLNLWLNTDWDHVGYFSLPNAGRKDDYVDLLATMDVLAVVAICGDNNLSPAGNFNYKPINLRIFEATPQTSSLAEKEWAENSKLKTQRTLKDFKQRNIRFDRELKVDPEYKPDFVNFPIVWKDVEVEFSNDEFNKVMLYRGTLGDTDDEVIRTLFFHWYLENRKRHGLRWYSPNQAHA